MKTGLLAGVAIVALSFGFAPAFAGPLEDGVKAYSHADYKTAQKLLMPLAEQGNEDAQYSVGMMYQKGQGVEEDKVKAHMWYDLASRDGDKDAAADRDALEHDMTPDQIASAKQAASQWKAKP
jgi:TPR repeat protein